MRVVCKGGFQTRPQPRHVGVRVTSADPIQELLGAQRGVSYDLAWFEAARAGLMRAMGTTYRQWEEKGFYLKLLQGLIQAGMENLCRGAGIL